MKRSTRGNRQQTISTPASIEIQQTLESTHHEVPLTRCATKNNRGCTGQAPVSAACPNYRLPTTVQITAGALVDRAPPTHNAIDKKIASTPGLTRQTSEFGTTVTSPCQRYFIPGPCIRRTVPITNTAVWGIQQLALAPLEV